MDLKEIVAKNKNIAESAHSSFHAGRLDDAENYLMVEMQTIARYFNGKTTSAGDVNESATSEKPAETLEETQEKVSGPGVHPAVVDPAPAAGKVLPASQFAKPTQ